MKGREIPVGIAFLVGILIFIEYFLKGLWPGVAPVAMTIQNWASIAVAFATVLAGINIVMVHSRRIKQQHADSWMSYLLFAGLVGMLATGFAADGTTWREAYDFLYGIFTTLYTATFSIMAFFLASAASRAFKMRNADAAILLATAIIVMLGNAPIGAVISSWFPTMTEWIMKYPNVAGNRAFMMATALGVTVTSIRVILGLSRSLE